MTVQGSFTNASTTPAPKAEKALPRVDLQFYTDITDTHLSAAYIERTQKTFGYLLCTVPKDDNRTFRALLTMEHTETAEKLKEFLARYTLQLTRDEAQSIRTAMACLPMPNSLVPDAP